MKYSNDVSKQRRGSHSLMSLNEETCNSSESWTPSTSFPKRVEVWWYDAETCGGPGWVDRDDADDYIYGDLPIIKSIGFLCAITDTHYAITDSVGHNQIGGVTKIPLGMVKEVYYLERTGNDTYDNQFRGRHGEGH